MTILWILGIVGLLSVAFVLYCCCRVASIADRQEEEYFRRTCHSKE